MNQIPYVDHLREELLGNVPDPSRRSVERPTWLTGAIVTPVTFFLILVGIGGLLLFGSSSNPTLSLSESPAASGFDVMVLFEEVPSADQLRLIETTVEYLAGIENRYWCDQACAWDEFKVMFADQPVLIEEMNPAILPVSFRFRLEQPDMRESVAAGLRSLPSVRKVWTAPDPVPNETARSLVLLAGGAVIGGLLSYAILRRRASPPG